MYMTYTKERFEAFDSLPLEEQKQLLDKWKARAEKLEAKLHAEIDESIRKHCA